MDDSKELKALGDKQHTVSPQRKQEMLRVDQAGEYGAVRIYEGQLRVMGDRHPSARLIRAMLVEEKKHLAQFNEMMVARDVAPTLLQPLWHIGGFALGAVTALMGPKAAMACTEAVETEIDKHYSSQLEQLGNQDAHFTEKITEFMEDELKHRDVARANGAQETPVYPILSVAIGKLCRVAIRLSEKF